MVEEVAMAADSPKKRDNTAVNTADEGEVPVVMDLIVGGSGFDHSGSNSSNNNGNSSGNYK